MDFTGVGSIAEFASAVIDRFFPKKMDDAERAQATLQLQGMLQGREDKVLEAQKSIIVAEMNQGDAFTKRARPAIVYVGLLAISLVHVVFPIVAWLSLVLSGAELTNMPKIALPGEFWAAWSGVCGLWIIGRSAEKRGANDKIVRAITGVKG